MITFTRSVGTSPGTTTLVLENQQPNGLGIQQCWPVPEPIHLPQPTTRPQIPEAGPRVVYDPYGSTAELNNGLGFVLSPWEINRTLPGGPPYQKPFDPFYTTRGEQGWYYDTQFGEIPTDAEYGKNVCYTPVKSGWIYDQKRGYVPPPWVPPDGWQPTAPQYGPPTSLHGAELGLQQAAGTLGDVAEELAKHQRRQFYLSIVSTAAIASVALVTIVQALRSKG